MQACTLESQLLQVSSVSAICNILLLLQVQERCWHLYADNCDRRRSNRPLKAASSPLIESQCSICILNLLQNEIGSALADWKLENNRLFLFCLTVLSIRLCHHPTYPHQLFAHIKKRLSGVW
ncbi:Protein SUPPRESSOR OF NPR1-1 CONSTITUTIVE [Trichinella spiralis]|uniref:Protein SUPPRESSOR OF NPR1-1 CONSTITUTIVE n=1 Tax=Trichinella spiralis TaxID=6334 RepID=A0ABR3KYF3_TRISP